MHGTPSYTAAQLIDLIQEINTNKEISEARYAFVSHLKNCVFPGFKLILQKYVSNSTYRDKSDSIPKYKAAAAQHLGKCGILLNENTLRTTRLDELEMIQPDLRLPYAIVTLALNDFKDEIDYHCPDLADGQTVFTLLKDLTRNFLGRLPVVLASPPFTEGKSKELKELRASLEANFNSITIRSAEASAELDKAFTNMDKELKSLCVLLRSSHARLDIYRMVRDIIEFQYQREIESCLDQKRSGKTIHAKLPKAILDFVDLYDKKTSAEIVERLSYLICQNSALAAEYELDIDLLNYKFSQAQAQCGIKIEVSPDSASSLALRVSVLSPHRPAPSPISGFPSFTTPNAFRGSSGAAGASGRAAATSSNSEGAEGSEANDAGAAAPAPGE
jgi:hypothetical protein